MTYDNFRLHKQLQLYVPPVLLLLGSVGNVLSLVILTRPAMRKYSAYVYLAVLAAADTLVLYVGLMRLWLGQLTGHDLLDASDWTCRLVTVVAYTVSDYSGWLIIAVTLERYVAVCHPLATSMGGSQRAKTLATLGGCWLCSPLSMSTSCGQFASWTPSTATRRYQRVPAPTTRCWWRRSGHGWMLPSTPSCPSSLSSSSTRSSYDR